VAYQTLSSRGERARFGELVEPLREEVDALAESFSRMRARNAKRVRDAGKEAQLELDPTKPPESPQEREAIKAAIRAQSPFLHRR